MDVIEHLPDPGIMLQRMHSVLRVGGKAIIGTPLFINRDLVSPYHVREFNVDELTTLVQGYFCDLQVALLPERRLDGIVYQNNFCENLTLEVGLANVSSEELKNAFTALHSRPLV